MLDLFAQFDIAATWATVGFLFAGSRQELEAFSPSLRPSYHNRELSPYDEPVGSGEQDDPLHFAPGLIARIAAHPRQEIGTHTFSHYYCLEPGQSVSTFAADIQSAVEIARKHGIQLRSIVFPRNQFNAAYASVLQSVGIVCYRGNERMWMYRAASNRSYTTALARAARLLDSYLPLSGCNLTRWDEVAESSGMCNVPSSGFLRPYKPQLKRLELLRLRRITRCIEQAAVSRTVFHLWWHPHNFGLYTDENLAFLRHILETVAYCRDRYGMRSLTMADVADIAMEH
jgi:hypothetical protein